MSARKDDSEKPCVDKLPFAALENVARVMAYGASKYGWDMWRQLPDGRRRYVAAALRHLFAHCRGEVNDAESGLPHLWHAACSVLFAMDAAEIDAVEPSADDEIERIHQVPMATMQAFAESCARAAREIGT